jgi:hypothetical protein
MPRFITSPLTANGVSAAKVVATMDVPKSHHGRLRPERKYSVVERVALLESKNPTNIVPTT